MPCTRSGSPAHASTIRWKWSAGGDGSASRAATASATTASAAASAAYSSALPVAATAAIAPGSTNAAAPSSASSAAISRSKPGPGSPHGPAQVESPMRWPSRRVRSNTSTVPASPSSAHVTSIAPVDDVAVLHDVVAGEQVVRERPPVEEQLVGQLAAQHLPVGDALARVGLGQRRRTTARPPGENRKRYSVPSPWTTNVSPSAARAARDRRDRVRPPARPTASRDPRPGAGGEMLPVTIVEPRCQTPDHECSRGTYPPLAADVAGAVPGAAGDRRRRRHRRPASRQGRADLRRHRRASTRSASSSPRPGASGGCCRTRASGVGDRVGHRRHELAALGGGVPRHAVRRRAPSPR